MSKEGRPGLRRYQPVPGVSPSKPSRAKSPNSNVDRWINVDQTKSNYSKVSANKIMRKLNRDLSPRPRTRQRLRPRRILTPDSNDGNEGFSPSSSSDSDIEIRVPVRRKKSPPVRSRTRILELKSDDREFKCYDITPIEDLQSPPSFSSNNWHFGRVYSEEIYEILEKHFKKFKGDYLSKSIVGEIFQEKLSDVPVDFDPSVAFEAIEVTQLETLYSFRNGRKSRLMFKGITMTTTNNKHVDIQDRERTILAVDSLADLLNMTLKQGDFLILFGSSAIIANNQNNVVALNSRLEPGCFIAHYRHDGVFSPFQNNQEQESEGFLANLDLNKFNYVYREVDEQHKEIVIKIQPNLEAISEQQQKPPQTSSANVNVISKGTQITPPQATIPHVETPGISSDMSSMSSRPSTSKAQPAASNTVRTSPRTPKKMTKDTEGELFENSDNSDNGDSDSSDIQQVEVVSLDSSDDEQSELPNVSSHVQTQHRQKTTPKSLNRNRVSISPISPASSRSTPKTRSKKQETQKKDKEIKLDQDEILLQLEEDIENSSDESFQSCIDLNSDLEEEDLNSQQSQSQQPVPPNVAVKTELSSMSMNPNGELPMDAQCDLNLGVNIDQKTHHLHHTYPPSSLPMESNENLSSMVEKKVADFIANVKQEKSLEQQQLQQVLQDFPTSGSGHSDGLPGTSSTQGSDQNNQIINNNNNNNNVNDSDKANNEIVNEEVEKKVSPSLLLNLRHRQVNTSPIVSPSKRKQTPKESTVQNNNNNNNNNRSSNNKAYIPMTTTGNDDDLHEDLNNNSVHNIESSVPEQVPTTSTSTKTSSKTRSTDEEYKKKYKLRVLSVRIKRVKPYKTSSRIPSPVQPVQSPQKKTHETKKTSKVSKDKDEKEKETTTKSKEKKEEKPKENKSIKKSKNMSIADLTEGIKVNPRLRSADRILRSGNITSPGRSIASGSSGGSSPRGIKRKSNEGKKKSGRPPSKKKKIPDHVATPRTRRKSQQKRNRF